MLAQHPSLILQHVLLYGQAVSERVARRGDDDHLVFHIRNDRKLGVSSFSFNKADIELICSYSGNNLFCVADGHLEADKRILSGKFS
ncbi:hypothetical protein D3C81_2086040 [compost metagenome]